MDATLTVKEAPRKKLGKSKRSIDQVVDRLKQRIVLQDLPTSVSSEEKRSRKKLKRKSIVQSTTGLYSKEGQLAYNCVFCHEDFDCEADLLFHIDCYFLRTGVDAINSGHEAFSGNKFKFDCELCNRTVLTLQSLRNHSMSHYEKMFSCNSCKEKFTLEQSAAAHSLRCSKKASKEQKEKEISIDNANL